MADQKQGTNIAGTKNVSTKFGENFYYDSAWGEKEPNGNGLERIKTRATGFYYDSQLEDATLILSLHPSTYLDENKKWAVYQEGYEPFGLDNMKTKFRYSYYPIARSILVDDPSFSLSNKFMDFNGGNPIEDIFNQMKPYGAMAGNWAEKIREALANTPNMGGTITHLANSGIGIVGKGLELMKEYSNKALFVQGTRYTHYNGSEFGINNLEMKFIRFSDWVKDESGNWKFQNVRDYIKNVLSPYCYGTYESLISKEEAESGPDGLKKDAKKFISEYCGVQRAPGGFEMETINLDNALKGTLRLNIGGMYALENLVIKSMNFSLSKVQAKDPTKPGSLVPLYAEIVLSLFPASMITDRSFIKVLEGKGLEKMQDLRKASVNSALDNIKTERLDTFVSKGGYQTYNQIESKMNSKSFLNKKF